VVITPLAAFAVSPVAGERLASDASGASGEVALAGGVDDATCDETLLVEFTVAGEVSSSTVLSLGGVVDVVLGVLVLAVPVAPERVRSGEWSGAVLLLVGLPEVGELELATLVDDATAVPAVVPLLGVGEALADVGVVLEPVLARPEVEAVVPGCAVDAACDAELEEVALGAAAVRELSRPSRLGKSERRSDVVILSGALDLISSLLNGTRKSPSWPAKLSWASMSTIALPAGRLRTTCSISPTSLSSE
jgi:hypothetical protein